MQADHPADRSMISPFSDAKEHAFRKKRKAPIVIWVIAGAFVFAIVAIAGFFVYGYLNDPLRTLEPFPVAKYLEGHNSLAGSKFRANLRVENDLGWKEGIGRLMVFTVRDAPHPIVVMVPPSLAQIYFVKGQSYEAELEVKEGGLIYANSCRKN